GGWGGGGGGGGWGGWGGRRPSPLCVGGGGWWGGGAARRGAPPGRGGRPAPALSGALEPSPRPSTPAPGSPAATAAPRAGPFTSSLLTPCPLRQYTHAVPIVANRQRGRSGQTIRLRYRAAPQSSRELSWRSPSPPQALT